MGVARNTIVLAYQSLTSEGYVIARERSGLYVNEDVVKGRALFARVAGTAPKPLPTSNGGGGSRVVRPGGESYRYPPDWQKYPFPFIEGRFDRSLFPVAEWREAARMALGAREVSQWSADAGDADDPMLVEEIRKKVLPRRGIDARPDEILITAGSQQALHILAELLTDRSTQVVVEEPGNVSFYELLLRRSARVVHQPVDQDGMIVDERIDGSRARLRYAQSSAADRRNAFYGRVVRNFLRGRRRRISSSSKTILNARRITSMTPFQPCAACRAATA